MHHECGYQCKEFIENDAPYPFETIEGIDFYRCPLREVDAEFLSFWFKAYRFYEKGLLPGSGGWKSETNKYIEVISFIENKIHEIARNEGEIAKQRIKYNPHS